MINSKKARSTNDPQNGRMQKPKTGSKQTQILHGEADADGIRMGLDAIEESEFAGDENYDNSDSEGELVEEVDQIESDEHFNPDYSEDEEQWTQQQFNEVPDWYQRYSLAQHKTWGLIVKNK